MRQGCALLGSRKDQSELDKAMTQALALREMRQKSISFGLGAGGLVSRALEREEERRLPTTAPSPIPSLTLALFSRPSICFKFLLWEGHLIRFGTQKSTSDGERACGMDIARIIFMTL